MTHANSDIGLLILRVVFGLLMAGHGMQKLAGWFGGYGLTKTGEFFVQLGFRPGHLLAAVASATETTGGLLVVLGLLGPIGPALIVSVMIVAAVTVHWGNGIFAGTNGIEIPALYAAAAVALALVGFGAYSLDSVLGIDALWTPRWTEVVLVAGALGGVVNVLMRRTPITA
ncbi:MAG TPA: DoxX family protein [Gemmatimonadaceae bacterium]